MLIDVIEENGARPDILGVLGFDLGQFELLGACSIRRAPLKDKRRKRGLLRN